jgi:formate dehydrogenase alpha subunit
MSTVEKKILNVKINGEETTVPDGTVVLEVCKQNDVEVSNLCYNRKLKPFAACRTCMVETVVDGKKRTSLLLHTTCCRRNGNQHSDRGNRSLQ